MSIAEATHVELLAEVDALLGELARWEQSAPDWPAARKVRSALARLLGRTESLKARLDAPLVVATLGGTGTGKSSLVNALVGSEVTAAGRQRPTTRLPTLVCRPGLPPQHLGIDPSRVHLVERDLPALRDLVLLDCPDPDTTEDRELADSNLARLRALLPHCDVLLVTATQQKYRSARVAEELAAAATGARLVFVQTHAAIDADIREDWLQSLRAGYEVGDIFLVDSLAALADAQAGRPPSGDFARLVSFLSRELSGAAAKRIRRANFLDLVADSLGACRRLIEADLPAVEQLEVGLAEQRSRLLVRMAAQLREELIAGRRTWEHRLLGEVASRWGLSPFSAVLRVYHGMGSLLAGWTLWRLRSPAQLALWGAVEGSRRWRRARREKKAQDVTSRALAGSWDEAELRTVAIIVDGYAADAGFDRQEAHWNVVRQQAAEAGRGFMAKAGDELQDLVARLAKKNTGWFTRWFYELALCVVLGLFLFRLGKNFFFDSWLAVDLGYAEEPAAVFGMDFFISAGFWFLTWCAILIVFFTAKLRRGMTAQINVLAQSWGTPKLTAGLFAGLESQCHQVRLFHEELDRLDRRVAQLKRRLGETEPQFGRKHA